MRGMDTMKLNVLKIDYQRLELKVGKETREKDRER